jgi:hypothetical protein
MIAFTALIAEAERKAKRIVLRNILRVSNFIYPEIKEIMEQCKF